MSAIVVADTPGIPQATKNAFYAVMGTSENMIVGNYNLTAMSRAVATVTEAVRDRLELENNRARAAGGGTGGGGRAGGGSGAGGGGGAVARLTGLLGGAGKGGSVEKASGSGGSGDGGQQGQGEPARPRISLVGSGTSFLSRIIRGMKSFDGRKREAEEEHGLPPGESPKKARRPEEE